MSNTLQIQPELCEYSDKQIVMTLLLTSTRTHIDPVIGCRCQIFNATT
jgi:hypothetical protein